MAHAFRLDYARKKILDHFHINSLTSLGCDDKPLLTVAAGVILDYLNIMQKSRPANIMSLRVYSLQETMELDYATRAIWSWCGRCTVPTAKIRCWAFLTTPAPR